MNTEDIEQLCGMADKDIAVSPDTDFTEKKGVTVTDS